MYKQNDEQTLINTYKKHCFAGWDMTKVIKGKHAREKNKNKKTTCT